MGGMVSLELQRDHDASAQVYECVNMLTPSGESMAPSAEY
jgi:hypothetical protein